MLLMGDEVRRTQRGNNNAYCQDNEISWLDSHPDVHRFAKHLLSFRLKRDAVEEEGLTLNELLRRGQVQWHGVKLNQPDWGDHSHSLACTVKSIKGRFLIHLIFNPYWEALAFELPPPGESPVSAWHRWIDTSLDAPDDICEWASAPVVTGSNYRVQPRSIAVLFARLAKDPGEERRAGAPMMAGN
jgi:glycogen operon protein